MALKTFTVNKLPGESGFLDELNSVVMDIAALADRVVRIEHRLVNFSGTRTIEHQLGVKPDFIWSHYSGDLIGTGCDINNDNVAAWTDRTVQFTLNGNEHDLFIMALT